MSAEKGLPGLSTGSFWVTLPHLFLNRSSLLKNSLTEEPGL